MSLFIQPDEYELEAELYLVFILRIYWMLFELAFEGSKGDSGETVNIWQNQFEHSEFFCLKTRGHF